MWQFSPYYDPQIGRFITEDSYWGKDADALSLNLYTYVANNPVNLSDPSGNRFVEDDGSSSSSKITDDDPYKLVYYPFEGLYRPTVYTKDYSRWDEISDSFIMSLGLPIIDKEIADSGITPNGRVLTQKEKDALYKKDKEFWTDTVLLIIFSGGKTKAPAIKTPYGNALQSTTKQSLQLRQYVNNGGQLFRGGKFGRSNVTDAQFWAPENPLNPGYANKYGVDFSKMDFIIGGKQISGAPYITRPAPGLGNNSGGGSEIVNNPNSVILDFFYMP